MKRQHDDTGSSDSDHGDSHLSSSTRTEGGAVTKVLVKSLQHPTVDTGTPLLMPIRTKPQSMYSEQDTLNRYKRRLGDTLGSSEQAENTIELFASYETTKQHDEADAVLSPIILSGMSQKGMRSLFHIGTGRFNRLRDGRAKKESPQPRNGQHITPEMLDYARKNVESWPFEDVPTCTHRSMNRYLKIGTTWKELWQKYSEHCATDSVRAMAYKTWMQYRHDLFPAIVINTLKVEPCVQCDELQSTPSLQKTPM